MNDLFLAKVGVRNLSDAMRNSIRASLQRNKTYKNKVSQSDRKKLRHAWSDLIISAAKQYNQPVTDAEHCRVITQIAQSLSQSHKRILVGGKMRFGTSQKAFNLYLKFLWRLGHIAQPPHCPVDGVILRAAGILDSWTKSDSVSDYMAWINAIRRLAGKMTIADWEYEKWNGA